MNKPQMPPEVVDQATNTAERLADSADQALKSTRRMANDTLDQVESAVDSARGNIQPVIAKLATQAESLARRGIDAVRDGASQVRERATGFGDMTVRYVRDEPVKSLLIAAAAGAAVAALMSFMNSRRNR
jgi:ElaB/YqjD/DUF883 family membrane-anchored ribosome-binding protein